MVKIRLMRIGAKKRPFYRVVAVDERSKRTGDYIELLGTYNPLTEPHEINLKQDRIDYWTKNGAQMSVGFLRIIGKAPQRQMRKPKKEADNKPEEKVQQTAPAEETPSETPTEQEAPQPEATEQAPEQEVAENAQETPTEESATEPEAQNEEKSAEEPKAEQA